MINTEELMLAEKALKAFKTYGVVGAKAEVVVGHADKDLHVQIKFVGQNAGDTDEFKQLIGDLNTLCSKSEGQFGHLGGQMGTYDCTLIGPEAAKIAEALDKVTAQKALGFGQGV
jgi:hypothetical protein